MDNCFPIKWEGETARRLVAQALKEGKWLQYGHSDHFSGQKYFVEEKETMGGKWINRVKTKEPFAESKDSRGKVSPWELHEPSTSDCAICFHKRLVVRDLVTTKPVLKDGREQLIESKVSVSQLRPTGVRGKIQEWWFHRQCWEWFIAEWR